MPRVLQTSRVQISRFFTVLCLLSIGMLLLERSNGFGAKEQSGYSAI